MNATDFKTWLDIAESAVTTLAVAVGGVVAYRRFVVAGGAYGSRCDISLDLSSQAHGSYSTITIVVTLTNPGGSPLRLDKRAESGVLLLSVIDQTMVAQAPTGTSYQTWWDAAAKLNSFELALFRESTDPRTWRTDIVEPGATIRDEHVLVLGSELAPVVAVRGSTELWAARVQALRSSKFRPAERFIATAEHAPQATTSAKDEA